MKTIFWKNKIILMLILMSIILTNCHNVNRYEMIENIKYDNNNQKVFWEHFLSLSPCEKVNYYDSINRYLYGNYDRVYDESLLGTQNDFYTMLTLKMEVLTNIISNFSDVDPHFMPPGYYNIEMLDTDVVKWRKILNCDSIIKK